MRLSAQPECSRALIQASITACIISSMCSELMPISRARFPSARAAAISMSSTIGRVNSICRSAVVVIRSKSCRRERSERQEKGNRGFDPGRNLPQTFERQEGKGVDCQHHWESVGGSGGKCVAAGCFCDIVHDDPPRVSGHPYRNRTATRFSPSNPTLSLRTHIVYLKSVAHGAICPNVTIWDKFCRASSHRYTTNPFSESY